MSFIGALVKAIELAKKKVYKTTASITGTGTISTPLSTIESAKVNLEDAETTLPSCGVEITGIVGGDVSVVVVEHAAAANAISAHAHTVALEAIGY